MAQRLGKGAWHHAVGGTIFSRRGNLAPWPERVMSRAREFLPRAREAGRFVADGVDHESSPSAWLEVCLRGGRESVGSFCSNDPCR